MGKRGPQPTGRTTGLIRLKLDTITAIRAQAAAMGVSQSVVVDRAMKVANILNLIWEEDRQTLTELTYEQLKRWKEQS